MKQAVLYEYAVYDRGSYDDEKQEWTARPAVIVTGQIVALDEEAARLIAMREALMALEDKEHLDRISVAVRPF